MYTNLNQKLSELQSGNYLMKVTSIGDKRPNKYYSKEYLRGRGVAAPKSPRSEFLRSKAQGPMSNIPKGTCAKRASPWGTCRRRPLVVSIISDSCSCYFSCRHGAFLVNLGPLALERS